MEKKLIKLCPVCQKYFYANMPHWAKSGKCKEPDKLMEDFRKQNDIPPYEVWHFSYHTENHYWFPQYDQEATQRNFMKMVYNKLFLEGII